MTERQKERVFIDFEASSLSSRSWPIEIGLAWLDSMKVCSDSRLILPRPSWDLSDWEPAAQEVHNISLDEVRASGHDADEVVAWLHQTAGDAELLSDAPEFDQHWLDQLLGANGPQIRDFEWVAWDAFSDHGTISPGRFSRVSKTKASRTSTHRAASDAEDLAYAWRAALKH